MKNMRNFRAIWISWRILALAMRSAALCFVLGLVMFSPLVVHAASSGQLSVTAQNQAAGSIALGALRVPMVTMRLHASCDAPVSLSSITVRHAGLGATSDIARIYLLSKTQRITRGLSVSARDPTVLTFQTVTVPACGSVDLTLVADISSAASPSSEHRFEIQSVGTTAQVALQSTTPASSPVRIVPSASSAVINAELLPVLQSIYYGPRQTVARLSLKARGSRDQQVTAVTLHNDGSASNADLQNFYFETQDGKRVSGVTAQMDGRIVRISFDTPLVLPANATKLLQLRADVRASNRKTITWVIEEPSDIEAQEVHSR